MSSFFLLNNIHFFLEMVGALVFLMVTWLLFDAYFLRKEKSAMFRASGFALLAVWQAIHAFNVSGDLAGYLGFAVYFLGLIAIIVSFFAETKIAGVSAVLILPAAASFLPFFNILISAGLAAVAFLSFRKYKAEFNKSLVPFWASFSFLSAGAVASIFYGGDSSGIVWIIGHLFELGGFLGLAFWVWQHLQLRIKESMILIFIATTFFMATAVTLAFSTIFVTNIESNTKANLLTNAKVLDYAVTRLKEESLAKSRFIAEQDDLRDALARNNFSELEQVATRYLENEHLGFLTIVDKDGLVILRAHALSQKDDDLSAERAVKEALGGKPFVTIESNPAEKFSIRAASPIFIQSKIKGAVITGFPLDNAMVDGIKRITGLEMSIFEEDTCVATTILNIDGRTRSVGVKETNTEVTDKVLVKGEEITLQNEILSRSFLASYIPIKNSDGKIAGMISAAKPQKEILEISNATNRLTFVTVIIIMLILIAPMYSITKRLIGGLI